MIQPKNHKKIASKNLYKNSYDNTLHDLRKHHRHGKKAFSRVLHAKGMDRINEYLELTLFQPKLMLSASVISFAGELISVFLAKIYNFSYNYLLFIYFFILGYVLALLYFVIKARLKK